MWCGHKLQCFKSCEMLILMCNIEFEPWSDDLIGHLFLLRISGDYILIPDYYSNVNRAFSVPSKGSNPCFDQYTYFTIKTGTQLIWTRRLFN